jgi:hypothetical protein
MAILKTLLKCTPPPGHQSRTGVFNLCGVAGRPSPFEPCLHITEIVEPDQFARTVEPVKLLIQPSFRMSAIV